MTNIKPTKIKELHKQAEIKAYVHPTRMHILRLLAVRKRTVSSIARDLGVHPANITHHFKLLEKTGLIRLVERRDIGKNIEKYYRSVARNFYVNLDALRPVSKKALMLSILRNNLTCGINTIQRNDKQEIIAMIKIARMQPGDIALLHRKIKKLVRDFTGRTSKKGSVYTLNISVYPGETQQLGHEKIVIND